MRVPLYYRALEITTYKYLSQAVPPLVIAVFFRSSCHVLSSFSKTSIKGPPIKRNTSIKQTLSRVQKRTSDISVYNKPLLRRTRTRNNTVSCIWLISIFKNLY